MIVVMFALKSCGISETKLPLKKYFYRSKLNFVSKVFYLINGTKEAMNLAIVPRWKGQSNCVQ